MPPSRLQIVAAVVVVLAMIQIFFEDVILFLGATRSGTGMLQSPYLMIGIPLLISVLLLFVLVGAAVLDSDTFR